jgi:xylulokinase
VRDGPAILTLDLGTSSCKASLWNASGALLAAADESYPTHHPHPDWAEQHAEDWWRAACGAAHRCLAQHPGGEKGIAAIGLSSQREGVVPVARDGRALGPCIIWMDRRSRGETETLVAEFGPARLHDVTGMIPDPTFTATKLLWLKTHAPEALGAAAFLQPRDYLYFRLTGALLTDYTLASRTMMFDIRARTWWMPMLDRLGVRQEQLPPLYASTEAPFRLEWEGASALGLPPGVPVAVGAGDRPCEVLGAAVAGKRVMESTGTATNVSMVIQAVPSVLEISPCSIHALPGRWLLEMGIITTASVLRWFRELAGLPPEGMETLEAEAAKSPPGARGLVALPFFMGARSVRLNPDARGALIGLSLGHGRGDIARAIMEGVAFEVGACLRGLQGMGHAVEEVRVLGGGARSDLWCQIKADVLGLSLARLRHTEAASVGAALLAGAAIGLVTDPEAAAEAWNPVQVTFTPRSEAHRAYAAPARLFEDCYGALAPLFGRVAAGQH